MLSFSPGLFCPDVSADLNGETMSVLYGAPNEFERMGFGGLNRRQFNFASMSLGLSQQQGAAAMSTPGADSNNSGDGALSNGEESTGGSSSSSQSTRRRLFALTPVPLQSSPDELTFEDVQRMEKDAMQMLHNKTKGWIQRAMAWI